MTQLNQLYFVYFSLMLRSSHPLQDAHQPPGYLSLMCVVNMFLTFFFKPWCVCWPKLWPHVDTGQTPRLCQASAQRTHSPCRQKFYKKDCVLCCVVLCCNVFTQMATRGIQYRVHLLPRSLFDWDTAQLEPAFFFMLQLWLGAVIILVVLWLKAVSGTWEVLSFYRSGSCFCCRNSLTQILTCRGGPYLRHVGFVITYCLANKLKLICSFFGFVISVPSSAAPRDAIVCV